MAAPPSAAVALSPISDQLLHYSVVTTYKEYSSCYRDGLWDRTAGGEGGSSLPTAVNSMEPLKEFLSWLF